MEMLLEQSGVNSDTPDNNGWTPLSWAASQGHDGAVKNLLQRNDVNSNAII